MDKYEKIKKYICNEPRMEPFLTQAKDECVKNNCQSWIVILELAIEKLLDAYENKCDDLDKMNCDVCKKELDSDYYHLHQGLCQECENTIYNQYLEQS